jgi:hypothetical protein
VDHEFPVATINKRYEIETLWPNFHRWFIAQEINLEDVIAMIENDIVLEVNEDSNLMGGTQVSDGYVYLLKSGDHYKIGKSDDIERKVKEIRTQMPESVVLVHTIKTDGISGVEQYWHRRFQEQRVNGEWFKLSRSDISAFKKRNFQ